MEDNNNAVQAAASNQPELKRVLKLPTLVCQGLAYLCPACILLYYGIPFTIVATKADKVAKSKRQLSANQNAKLVGAPPWGLPFSAETGAGREELLKALLPYCAQNEEPNISEGTKPKA